MKKTFVLLAAVFLVVVGILLWWFSDAQVVKRNTRSLAKTLTMAVDDGKSTRALKGQDFAALLATDFTGTADIDNYSGRIGRDEAVSGHQYLALSSESSHVTVANIEITSMDDATATVAANFAVLVKTKSGSSRSDSAAATLTWEKTADEVWKLKTARLEKSP